MECACEIYRTVFEDDSFGFLDSDPFIRPLTWQMILARVTEEVSE